MRITQEWAKQLAREAFGTLDFASMHIEYMQPGEYRHAVVKYPDSMVGFHNNPNYDIIDPVMFIYPNKFYDAVNFELTKLGYCIDANVLVVGETKVLFPQKSGDLTFERHGVSYRGQWYDLSDKLDYWNLLNYLYAYGKLEEKRIVQNYYEVYWQDTHCL